MDSAFRLPTASNWRLREKTCLPGPLFPWGTDPAWGVGRPRSQWPDNPEEYWFYHAISDVMLINNFLRQRAEVNSDHIGILGVSWGGVIASHVLGLDSRFAFAVPVYGCGFLHESKGAQSKIFKLRPEWDASVNLENADLPVFWASGATDLHFTPEDRFKSKQLSMGSEPNSVGSKWSRWFMLPYIPHSGTANYSDTQFPEKINYIRFADAVIASMNANGGVVGDPALLTFSDQVLADTAAEIHCATTGEICHATLYYTFSTGIWSERTWSAMTPGASLVIDSTAKTVAAEIPDGAAAYYINVTEQTVSGDTYTASSDLFVAE